MKTLTSLGHQFRGAAAAGSLALIGAFGLSTAAEASLVTFKSYTGKLGLSTDGWGGSDGSGVISASAESGSKVVAAYLYTASQYFSSGVEPTTVTLDGAKIDYTSYAPNPSVGGGGGNIGAYRADVTSLVKSKIDGGGGGVYNFDIAEGSFNSDIDGHALVVVYENSALPVASIGILDGYASVAGDNTAINFADPLDPTAPDFFAEMRLGINFSCCSQASVVKVNGDVLTQNAGNFDDGESQANGSLITVGGFDDPLSSGGASYANDRERYDLASFIAKGDTSISVDTINATRDDNIFLAAFYVKGKAGFNEEPPDDDTPAVPLPAAGWLLAGGLMGLAGLRRRAKR
jgi:hypothetical protein